MEFPDILVQALVDRFKHEDLRLGTPPDPTVVFRAKHADVGDFTVSAPTVVEGSTGGIALALVTITIGEILHDQFLNLDDHLAAADRAERVTRDVVRFLDHLFADQLLFWQSADVPRTCGWRECRDATEAEPLVLDDRSYDVYLWSRPLPRWRATTAILKRDVIRDERDYHILRERLHDPAEAGWQSADEARARRLIADYERDGR